MYINTHSHYSLRYGTLSIPQLIELAKENHIEQLALTDINNSTGIIEFAKLCISTGLKPVAGIEFRDTANRLLYIGIAKNTEGFRQLNEFLTFHNLNSKALPEKPWQMNDVYIIYPFGYDKALCDNEYIGIRYTELNKLFGKSIRDFKDKYIALQPVTFNDIKQQYLHSYLRAIDMNTIRTKLEPGDYAQSSECVLPLNELQGKFSSYPFLLANTEKLMNNCSFDFDFKTTNKNKRTYTESAGTDRQLLEKLAMEGMIYRYGPDNKEAERRIKRELKVIFDMNFCAYFLITWDIIRHTMSKGFYHVGRGSGANSIVAYCMRITDVDPIELDLYFERFLNPNRSSPPDFDIDYAWNERDEVFDYIFNKYGQQHTALLGTMTTFQNRSIFRELGKVEGLPKREIDNFLDPSSGKIPQGKIYKRIMKISELMKNMPNQRSVHAGGVLISELPLSYYSALDLPPKGRPTVQWDMYTAEDAGLEKFDILSQRGIGHIKDAVQLVQQNRGIHIDAHAIQEFTKDEKIKARLSSGDTIGCFYVESPAMRGLLKKLKCSDYITLVAASSIIRPGVAQSGMMREYISRFNNQAGIKYLHPVMEEQLKETFGVMVYQEDVIKICHYYAGLGFADSDVLRRLMSGKHKFKAKAEQLISKFFEEAEKLGRDEETTKEVWRQIASFAGFSFSKAHSASFAVESYQSLYLKTYFPMEFMVAVLNNYGGFYTRWLYVHEARKAGALIHLPCVNNSSDVVNIKGSDVYLGFTGINNLEERFIKLIPEEREMNGEYVSLEDFIGRTAITLEQALLLIRIGALRFTGKDKKQLLWELYNYLGHKTPMKRENELFTVPSKNYQLPRFENHILEDVFDEIEALGFPVSLSYFDILKTSYRGDVMVRQLSAYTGKVVKMLGMFVTHKTVYTSNNKNMYFGTFIDYEGNFFDTVHFPDTCKVFPFKGNGCYLILGKVTEDFGFHSIEVMKFAKLVIQNLKDVKAEMVH